MFICLRAGRLLVSVLTAAAVAAAGAACFAASDAFGALQRTQAGAQEEGVKLPIVMYHSVLKERQRLGTYVVSPETVESDIRYLNEKGYQTVTIEDLLAYEDRGVPLPSKPVMLTFDDGYYNNYTYVYPLAQKYGIKVVIAPVGLYTDSFTKNDADHAAYSYLTWGEIAEMSDSGFVEIQNHSYNLHESKGRLGASKKAGESAAAYTALLGKDLRQMQDAVEEHTGRAPTAFVYPFGAVSQESIPVVKEIGFRASLTCRGKINVITKDPECLYGLGRFLRPWGISSWEYFRKIGVT